jgi:sec-independent protein translocase protein TatA
MPFTSGIGVTELIIVLVIVLVIFGPKRLPAMGRALGSGMREFKDSISNKHKDEDDEHPEIAEAKADAVEAQGLRDHAAAKVEAKRLRAQADALEADSHRMSGPADVPAADHPLTGGATDDAERLRAEQSAS